MEFKQGRTEIIDSMDKIHENEHGNIVCCKEGFELMMHADGTNYFMNTYRCLGCGNTIKTKTKRTKEDRKWWR